MIPSLALLLTVCFVLWLLWADLKSRRAGSRALLIPGIWIAIMATRPVSYWFGAPEEDEMNVEGNPINTATLAILIISAIFVLQRRGIDWANVLRKNKVLFSIYFFFALTAIFTEMPFICLKRVFKDFGCVLAALVLLTEMRPDIAIRAVFVRIAYIVLPLSIICWKYFPAIGRTYTHDGTPMFNGLSTQKNTLGQATMVFGMMILYDFLQNRKLPLPTKANKLKWVSAFMLAMATWILMKSDSKTSLTCMLLGVATLWWISKVLEMKNGKRILAWCMVIGLMTAGIVKSSGISDIVFTTLGRDPTLTGRTAIWDAVKAEHTDPVIGEGFNLFWSSAKGKAVTDQVGRINTTHNGYLEMYVDGGLAATTLLIILLYTTGRRWLVRVFTCEKLSELGISFWVVTIFYNFSESSFFRLDVLWIAFLLFNIEVPRYPKEIAFQSSSVESTRNFGRPKNLHSEDRVTPCRSHADN